MSRQSCFLTTLVVVCGGCAPVVPSGSVAPSGPYYEVQAGADGAKVIVHFDAETSEQQTIDVSDGTGPMSGTMRVNARNDGNPARQGFTVDFVSTGDSVRVKSVKLDDGTRLRER
ncbi:MAG: hypothetical protein KDA75_00795 [Planctomycetaceae bacterium]|nr:hypothetical protein [Planctomycetaceae bacterium]